MAFPASRDNSGALNTLATGAFEAIQPGVQDLVYKETTLLNLSKAYGMYETGRWSHHIVVPVVDRDDATVTSFSGTTTLSTNLTQGARSAYYGLANYAGNIGIAWEETEQISGPTEIVNLLETRAFKTYRAMGARLDQDMFWGNTSNSMNLVGLEQIVNPASHSVATPSLATAAVSGARWRYRQAANTVGGVLRTVFTADGVGGTNYENLSLNMKGDFNSSELGTANVFALSSGVPNKGLQVLNHFYQALTWGITRPNLIISTPKPYEDYQLSAMSFLQYVRTGGEAQAADLGFSTTSFRGAQWVQSDRAYASGVNGNATAGTDIVYMLNTKSLGLKVSETADFVTTDFVKPVDQAASVAQVLWRGQLVGYNPRYNGCLFNYGLA